MRVDKAKIQAFLESKGFDLSEGTRVRCSQCEACAINGVACHETGCPNTTHECAECDAQIKKQYRLCESCANPEQFYDDQDALLAELEDADDDEGDDSDDETSPDWKPSDETLRLAKSIGCIF